MDFAFSVADMFSDSSISLEKSDLKHFMTWGAIGFLCLGTYKMSTRIVNKSISPSANLIDETESLHVDAKICEAFTNLQEYRDLNPWLFKTGIQNVDHLLFLEQILLNGESDPVPNDKVIAFSHFRMALHRLNSFQKLVSEQLGNEHGLAVQIYIESIYEQLQKHLLNIFHMCSQFDPSSLISRAKKEVQFLLKKQK